MELKHRIRSRHVFAIVYFACLFGFLIFNIANSNTSDTHADSQNFNADASIIIPSIGLRANVFNMTLEDGELNVPDYDAGSYSRADNKTFITGHRSTVFSDLDETNVGDEIIYEGRLYQIISSVVMRKPDVSMNNILRATTRDTLVLMTCAGESLENKDATHRLIITAVLQ